jgi:hypothetical protein
LISGLFNAGERLVKGKPLPCRMCFAASAKPATAQDGFARKEIIGAA